MYEVRRIPTQHGRSLAQQASDILYAYAARMMADGHAPTVPSNWAASLTALGLSHLDPELAAETLAAVFETQWRTGLLPSQATPILELTGQPDDVASWSNGAASTIDGDPWGTRGSAAAPPGVVTSGIVHPPIHATVALRIAGRLGPNEGPEFLGFLYPRLAAWHDYLLASRTRNDVPLAEIWHPEESAMAASITWDPLVGKDAEGAPSSRPEDRAARMDELIDDMRSTEHQPGAIRAVTRFAVHSVMFNSLLTRAELDLAEIAQRIGRPGGRHLHRSRRIATLINRELFDAHDAWYSDISVLDDRRLPLASAAGLAPMFAGVPDPSRAALVADLRRAMAAPDSSRLAGMMASADPEQQEFSLTEPWRGPASVVTNWLAYEGLMAYGYVSDAAEIRDSIISAAMREGFWEHFDVFDGHGRGATNVSPITAAVVTDLLATEHLEPDAA